MAKKEVPEIEKKVSDQHESAKKDLVQKSLNIDMVKLAQAIPGTVSQTITKDEAILEFNVEAQFLVITMKSKAKGFSYVVFPPNIAYIKLAK